MKSEEIAPTTTATQKPSACATCGAPLTQPITGRPKVACSEKCRKARLKAVLLETLSVQETQIRSLLQQAMATLEQQMATRRKL